MHSRVQLSIIFLAVAFTSCGKWADNTDNDLNSIVDLTQIRVLDQVTEVPILTNLCNALKNAKTTIPTFYGFYAFNYSSTITDCDLTFKAGTVVKELDASAFKILSNTLDVSYEGITTLELPDGKTFSEFCLNPSESYNIVKIDSSSVKTIEFPKCGDTTIQCVQISYARKSSDDTYRKYAIADYSISLKATPNLKGLVIRKTNKSVCRDDSTRTNTLIEELISLKNTINGSIIKVK